jgi:hypothetical protein
LLDEVKVAIARRGFRRRATRAVVRGDDIAEGITCIKLQLRSTCPPRCPDGRPRPAGVLRWSPGTVRRCIGECAGPVIAGPTDAIARDRCRSPMKLRRGSPVRLRGPSAQAREILRWPPTKKPGADRHELQPLAGTADLTSTQQPSISS